jgi:hypothetical protein
MAKDPLVGKFFYCSSDGYYRTGRVLARLVEGLYMLSFDPTDEASPRPPGEVYPVYAFASGADREWMFFDSRAHLKAWESWLDTDTELESPEEPEYEEPKSTVKH